VPKIAPIRAGPCWRFHWLWEAYQGAPARLVDRTACGALCPFRVQHRKVPSPNVPALGGTASSDVRIFPAQRASRSGPRRGPGGNTPPPCAFSLSALTPKAFYTRRAFLYYLGIPSGINNTRSRLQGNRSPAPCCCAGVSKLMVHAFILYCKAPRLRQRWAKSTSPRISSSISQTE
jgi:hypothetical protein